MRLRKKYNILLWGILILVLTGFAGVSPDPPKKGFWAMPGTMITHLFIEKGDSLSGPEIFELQDENGISVWFGRYIFKDVCISGECKMIRLWLFWDGVGNYLGMEMSDEELLTKSDHSRFEAKDYEKLEFILRDSASVLKLFKQEDLVIIPDSFDPYKVDGYTAATKPTIAEVVVKDAVYTCHTLWHTVYGPAQKKIYRMLDSRIDEKYLENMFASQKIEYLIWAIESVIKHPEYHDRFYKKILSLIKSENSDVSIRALHYFQPAMMNDLTIQLQLVYIMEDAEMNVIYEILWKFIKHGQINQRAIINLLEMFKNEKIGVGAYNLILRLVLPEHLEENPKINQILEQLAKNKNSYIRNLTIKRLNSMKE